ncbi:MAG: flagellar biosynthesis protein FlhB [Verrucomicrobia bacterium]|nr:flagellar biosynthesis protein FlhB [Verrucomicrobiota bacterium]
MSDNTEEKTEQPTPKRLEEAVKKGQIARSKEVQTVFVLLAGLLALAFAGREMWQNLITAQAFVLGHLHEVTIKPGNIQHYAISVMTVLSSCVMPVMIAVVAGGLLAGAIQNRFQTSNEALNPKWDKLNPISGLKNLISKKSLVQTLMSIVKLLTIVLLTYSEVREVLTDPIFYTAVSPVKIAGFLAESAFSIILRVALIMIIIATVDYAYQLWQHNEDMKMSKQEVKDETKNQEGNPEVKSKQKSRRFQYGLRRMLSEVPQADVVVTNPTHYAVALRYDSKQMNAPKIVAKGVRLNAKRIKDIALENQVPIVENKPLARLMYKYGKPGGEIPASLYAAVAEILAWVYRVNRYRYYQQANIA